MSIRWSAEWEPHQGIWVAWPHNEEDWPGRFGPVPWVFADFLKKLARFEHLHIFAQKNLRPDMLDIFERVGIKPEDYTLHDYATNRVWTRDFCSTWIQESGEFMDNNGLTAVKWQFNGWAKYDNWQADEAAGIRVFDDDTILPSRNGRRIVLEGGSIDGNGHGTMLTTRECLLSDVQCRNPGFTQADYEAVFKDYLGINHTIWLNKGIAGDDTHGHIDDLARFVNRDTVVCVYESDKNDVNHEPTKENVEILRNSKNADGKPISVITLPMPAPIIFDGQRLPASYANFLIANGAVFVPTFNDAHDRHALTTLAHCFPDREIISIYCGDLVWGLGTLHCMTMQMPAPV
ncbi:MAG TPA: agmatine deiminase family protein [Gemmatales bacterium]|nr:agmatine deiminase family protein [Gemmatales bacterium]